MINIITECKQQAGIQDNPDQEGLDLFAELIIKECIELVETTPRHCAFTTHDLSTVECTIQKTSERLHGYFGIQQIYKTTSERTSIKEIPKTRRSL
jgi:ABC-type Na+ transport system ATPase subunit NatA